jgi:hypothetical protein
MPFYKISQLGAASQANATDLFEAAQSGTSRRVTAAQLASYVRTVATNTITAAAGSAATPAISPTGDPNTGIFFPAADTVAFAEGGAEIMRIASTGNVGIGTTTPGAHLNVVANSTTDAIRITQTGAGNAFVVEDSTNPDATPFLIDATGGVNFGGTAFYDSFGTTPKTQINDTGLAGNTLAINSWRNVSSSGGTLTLNHAKSGTIGTFTTLATGDLMGAINFAGADGTAFISSARIQAEVDGVPAGSGIMPGRIVFSTAPNSSSAPLERMRLTATGELYVAGTTDQGAYNLQVNGTGIWAAGAYVNGSDARIKENVVPLASGLDVVMGLKPVQFNYKADWCADNHVQPGFIAQDLQAALADKPYLDGVVKQGAEYLSVSYQALIPVLTKALQEMKAEVDALKARIATLESR